VKDAKLWWQKWRWYERNSLPWNRARIHREFARRRAFCRWPVHGNVLEAFREGRLEVGEHTLFEPGVWITAPGSARIRIGSGSFLNLNVMVAAVELVEIGDHVWCGANVVVTSGVTIGERAVIGANSVVTTDVPAYSIVAGVPARVLKPDWRLPGVGGLEPELPTSS
jgi:acetyltransferase-like isoleucine patch superfamily enzyme